MHAYAEQHVKVMASPMAKIATLLEQACAKLKPALDPSVCSLVIVEGKNKRVLDLQCPFRLANIPTNAKIEVVKGDAMTLLWDNSDRLSLCRLQG